MYDKKDDNSLLEEAKGNFQIARDYWQDNYDCGEDDQKFVQGVGQWDQDDERKRRIDNRPSLTLNQMLPYCNQVVNDIRQARPSIRVTPADSAASVETAKVFSGLIRNIERQCKATDAYDTAAANSVTAGLGWLRVSLDYENEYTFDQEIKIERILKFNSAYIDPSSMRLDGSDAEYCFIYDDISHDKFKELYPDADIPASGIDEGWANQDTVRVAEYYCKKYEDTKLYMVRYQEAVREGTATLKGVVVQEELDIMDEQGIVYDIVGERDTKICKVKQITFTGDQILGETEWPSKYLPLVPVWGLESFIDGKRRFSSLAKQGKDAQRMYNYWKSAATEFMALQPKAPWVAPLGSFKSNPNDWADSNRTNLAYLEYDIVYGQNGEPLPPPTRTPPITGSPAMLQEAESARNDIRLALGMGASNMGLEDNAISGIAVRYRQIEGDNATFHFSDNLSSSIAQLGCIIVDLIPKVYSDAQIRRIVNEDGTEELVPINQPFVKGENGLQATFDKENDGMYDLRQGKYDVICDVGPSYSSQRQEASDKILETLNARPELFDVMGDLLFQSLDMPYGQEIADRIRATMDPSIFTEDAQAERLKQAAAQIQQLQEQLQTLDAALQSKEQDKQFEQNYKLQELQLKRDELSLKAQETQADIAKTQSEIIENRQSANKSNADAEKSRAETAKIIGELQEDIASISEAIGIMFDDIERDRQKAGPESATTIDIKVEETNNE